MVVQKESKINELLQNIADYGNNKFSLTPSKDDIQNALLSYLSSHDMDIIFATQNDAVVPHVKSAQNLKYVLANYIAYSKDSNVAMFNLIVEIAVGHVLANTILYADKLQKFSGKFEGLYFYIDAKFVFRLLGYEGDIFKSAYIELIHALHEQGAKVQIFNHTFDEVTGVLKGAIRWMDAAEYDPAKASSVMRFYRNSGKNNADIQHDFAMIDVRLNEFDISIVPAPEFINSKDRQIDESALQDYIIEVYSENVPDFDAGEKQYTLEKDIKSISSIYHLRKNFHPLTLKQAEHFFLTSNGGLAYASRCYEMKNSEWEKFIPACVTDMFIGTLVWMQSPVRWVQINQKRFLADCMALLTPSATFIKRLIEEAQKLKDIKRINDDEFMVLRTSIYVQHELMKETFGDSNSINAESIEDTINRIRGEATAPLEQKIKQKDSEMAELLQKNKLSDQKKEEYRNKLENLSVNDANLYTKYIVNGLLILFFLTLIISFIDKVSPVRTVLQLLSICFAAARFVLGLNMKNIKERVFSAILTKMRKKYGIDN